VIYGWLSDKQMTAMEITILGTESLGVRGLSCVVQAGNRKIVIDPGIALGYRRYGLLPHPVQVSVGKQARRKIVAALQEVTDVVFSHFHGDHIPLPDANPYQLNARLVAPLLKTIRIWCKGGEHLSHKMALRRKALIEILGRDLPNAESQRDGPLAFSVPVPHGDKRTRAKRR
jgi:predicted metallo-beta-lactamase superfamily hydrolase